MRCLILYGMLLLIASCKPAQSSNSNKKVFVDKEGHIEVNNHSYTIPDLKTPVLLDENKGWKRDYKNVLSGFYSLYQSEVVQVDGDEYPYKMWFMGWAHTFLNNADTLPDGSFYPGYEGGDAVFFARSKNMDDWQVYSKKK